MMWSVIKANPISTFAVLVVSAIGAFLAYMMIWQTSILTSPDWCAKAQRAERLAPGVSKEQSLEVIKSCNEILVIQLKAIATDSHLDHGVQGFVLIVLIVVVIAGARASWKLGAGGLEGSVSRQDEAEAAAEHVVQGAEKAAAEVKAP